MLDRGAGGDVALDETADVVQLGIGQDATAQAVYEGIDIEKTSLSEAVEHCRPWVSDYLLPRHKPLTIRLLLGSALEPTHLISRQVQCVTCCEV